MNIDLNQISWMRDALNIKSNEALRLLQLYGYIEYVSSGGNAIEFKQSVYSDKTGFTRTTIQRDLQILAKNRWMEVHGGLRGTSVTCLGIDFSKPHSCTPSEQVSSPWTCTPSEHSDVQPVDSGVSTECASLKKGFKNSSSKEEEGGSSSKNKLKEELIQTWNEHKPKNWPALQAISPSRDRSIRALGGYREVIELLPLAMAGAKVSKFWNAKGFTWENLIGSGITPKGHIHSLAETAPPSAGSSSNSDSYVVAEHPDFFAPIDATSDLRAKHNNFANDDDWTAREAEARAFYTQHSEA